jgi:GDP-4-dehydro-6-deoxy-D-mannose reductase
LITGVGGFAGRYLAEHLAAKTTWEVWGNVRDAVDAKLAPSAVRCVVADLRDPHATDTLVEQARPDYVFHLAAQAFVPQSWVDPWDTYETNLRSQLNLLEALRRYHASSHVLVVGSNEIYGLIAPEHLPVKEDSPLRPTSPYAVSKIAQDFGAFQYFVNYSLPIVRVRPFNHIGPRQSEKFVASAFARQIALIEAGRSEPVVKVGNLSAQRDFTDVRDMVRAYRLAIEQGEPGEVYNIGSERPRSIQYLLDTLLSFSSASIKVEVDPARLRPSDVPVAYCDASRFKQCTGWTPEITFEQTLRDVLDDWRVRVKEGHD